MKKLQMFANKPIDYCLKKGVILHCFNHLVLFLEEALGKFLELVVWKIKHFSY